MKRLIAHLAAAAVALTAFRAARACEPAAPHPAGVGARMTFTAPLPAPALTVQRVDLDERWQRHDHGAAWDGDDHDRDGRQDHERWERERRAHLRDERWRTVERERLRAEYARLEDARADFYARPHRAWDVRHFEAWYAGARAELDARWSRMGWVAWR